LTSVIDPGGVAINAAGQWGERCHDAIFPSETEANVVCDRGEVSQSAAPRFVQWIHIGSFGNTRELTVGVLVWPGNGAVRASKGAKVKRPSNPQECVLIRVSTLKGIAGDPAHVVDAGGCGNSTAARMAEVEDVISRCLLSFLCHCEWNGKRQD
jgi:hypothetical protein